MKPLTTTELIDLVRRVFRPGAGDEGLALMADLPDERLADNPDWRRRRELVHDWHARLVEAAARGDLGGGRGEPGIRRVTLAWYRNAGGNNADLPPDWRDGRDRPVPSAWNEVREWPAQPFARLYAEHSLLIAPTELSATAPLKVAARAGAFRAATMPGFSPAMVPALRLDYGEVARRVGILKRLLDEAEGCLLRLRAGGREHELRLDLRHRRAHASDGLLTANGIAGNLPSGEAYIVPYEGEREGDPSRSEGVLPVQFDDEVVLYEIRGNRAVAVLSRGPQSERERRLLESEPAYANLAELGLGVLGGLGIGPVGSILLDEKLGLHVAFGRSDHFGGIVGPKDFSRPEAVVHIDRVYIPQVQPLVEVVEVRLELPGGPVTAMRNGDFVGIF